MARRAGHPKHGTHSHASCGARSHPGTRAVMRARRLRAPAGTVSTNDTAEDCHNSATSVLQFRKDQARGSVDEPLPRPTSGVPRARPGDEGHHAESVIARSSESPGASRTGRISVSCGQRNEYGTSCRDVVMTVMTQRPVSRAVGDCEPAAGIDDSNAARFSRIPEGCPPISIRVFGTCPRATSTNGFPVLWPGPA